MVYCLGVARGYFGGSRSIQYTLLNFAIISNTLYTRFIPSFLSLARQEGMETFHPQISYVGFRYYRSPPPSLGALCQFWYTDFGVCDPRHRCKEPPPPDSRTNERPVITDKDTEELVLHHGIHRFVLQAGRSLILRNIIDSHQSRKLLMRYSSVRQTNIVLWFSLLSFVLPSGYETIIPGR